MIDWRRFTTCAIGSLGLLALSACGGDDGNIGEGAAPDLNTEGTLSFEKVGMGETGTQTLRITNDGKGPLKVSSIEIDEGGEDNEREVRVKPGWKKNNVVKANDTDKLDVQIEYAPINALEDEGTIRIKSNDNDPKVHKVDLNFRPLDPRLQGQKTVQFPSVKPLPNSTCDRDTRKITLENIGDSPLAIKQLQFGSNEGFWVTYPKPGASNSGDQPSGNDGESQSNESDQNNQNGGDVECSRKHPSDIRPQGSSHWPVDGINGKLQPGETMELRIWFEPETNKPAKSTLQINWADTQETSQSEWYEINLVANADTPCLRLAPQRELDFGSTTKNKTSKRPVTIENCRPRSSEPLKIQDIQLTETDNNAFKIQPDSLPKPLRPGNDGTLTIDGKQSKTFTVVFTPSEGNKTYDGEMLIKSNDPDRSGPNSEGQTLSLVGKGSDNICPKAKAQARVEGNQQWRTSITTLPLKTVQLRSQESTDPDGSVERYEWTVLKRPADSTRPLRPGPNDPNPTLKLDLAGEYKLELVVYDNEGAASCGEQRAIVTIQAIPQEDIHVQLVWDTPSDTDQTDKNGTDLDLHYVRPTDSASPNWNDLKNDVFWRNQTPTWDDSGNPSLDIDDTNGKGPENVNHDNPNPNKAYKVGVHYYADRGLGASYATVRIYLEQELKREFKDKFMPGTDTFWYVGKIKWQSRVIFERDIRQKGFPTQ
jgi:hypothetical protein